MTDLTMLLTLGATMLATMALAVLVRPQPGRSVTFHRLATGGAYFAERI